MIQAEEEGYLTGTDMRGWVEVWFDWYSWDKLRGSVIWLVLTRQAECKHYLTVTYETSWVEVLFDWYSWDRLRGSIIWLVLMRQAEGKYYLTGTHKTSWGEVIFDWNSWDKLREGVFDWHSRDNLSGIIIWLVVIKQAEWKGYMTGTHWTGWEEVLFDWYSWDRLREAVFDWYSWDKLRRSVIWLVLTRQAEWKRCLQTLHVSSYSIILWVGGVT